LNFDHIRLAVFDVDGTILDRNFVLSQGTIDFLKWLKAGGVILALATGRSLIRTKEYAIRIDDKMQLILLNGAWGHDLNSSEDWRVMNLSPSVAMKAVELLRKWDYEVIIQKAIPESHIFYYDTLDSNNQERYGRIMRNLDRCIKLEDITSVLDRPIGEITVLDADERIIHCRDMLLQEDLECQLTFSTSPFNVGYSWLEVLHSHATKGEALKHLASRLGIDQDKVLAVGDNYNDVEMLRWAGVGVAMGHSAVEVQKVADIVLPKVADSIAQLRI
jgi:Cof subfamily protein (haloacid dehalogenase superfamily)